MRLFLLAALTILPGSLISFGIPLHELNWRTRLALGVALSPIVLGIQLYLLRVVNVEFASAALIILFVNLTGLIFLKRRSPKISLPRLTTTFFVASAMLSLFFGLMLMMWLWIPNFRAFSWHSLLHTDIVYLITRNPFHAEEPGLADIALAAPWIDHVYWSITGWLTDCTPTILYPITNMIWLIIAFVLGYELASHGLGLHSSSSLLASGLMFAGTNVIGAISYLVTGNRELLGDVRYTPLLAKYFGFETMPFAFALLIGLSLICVLILEKSTRHLWLLVPMLLAALGLMYPVLFPAGCIIVSLTALLVMWRSRQSGRSKLPVIGLTVALIVCSFMVTFSDTATSVYQINAFGKFTTNAKYALAALLPLVILGSPFVIKGIRDRRPSIMLLTAAGLCSAGLYLLFSLRNLEYKYVLAATLSFAPLAAGGVDWLFSRSLRARWIVSMLSPPAFVLVFALLILQTGAQVPDNLGNAPNIIEDSFWIRLNKSEDDSGWTRAVHAGTPEDTILVINDSAVNIGSFVNRSLFFPGNVDSDTFAGYSVNNEYYLLEQRGYPKASFEYRSHTVWTLYTETDGDKLSEAVNTFLSFERPIAIHFLDRNTPSLIWMKQNNIGSELYSDAKNVVWFINRRRNPSSHLSLDSHRSFRFETSTDARDAPSLVRFSIEFES